jgi:hypothetical protein
LLSASRAAPARAPVEDGAAAAVSAGWADATGGGAGAAAAASAGFGAGDLARASSASARTAAESFAAVFSSSWSNPFAGSGALTASSVFAVPAPIPATGPP